MSIIYSTQQAKRKIFVSEMSIGSVYTFLPHLWTHLKTHCEQYTEISDNYYWEDPLFQKLLDLDDLDYYFKFKNTSITGFDVICFSVYTWNRFAQLDIAKKMKAENPNALCIFGGPEISWQDEDIFTEHPFIDIIVKGEGEESMADILKQRLVGNDYTQIPGLLINQSGFRYDTGQHRIFWESVNAPSPWLAQEDRLETILADDKEYQKQKLERYGLTEGVEHIQRLKAYILQMQTSAYLIETSKSRNG